MTFLLVLQAETMDDLYEWKAALENALGQAPSAAHVMGQNGIFRNDQTDSVDNSLNQCMPLLSCCISIRLHMFFFFLNEHYQDVIITFAFIESNESLYSLYEYVVNLQIYLRIW
jgi:hypothetical protein